MSNEYMINEEEYQFETIIPKYTSYQITNLLNEKLCEYKNIDEFCKHYNVNKKLIKVILDGPNFFSLDMYKAASIILGKSVKELTKIEKINNKTNFRKSEKCLIENIKSELDFANMMFNEIIINAKFNANTGSEVK